MIFKKRIKKVNDSDIVAPVEGKISPVEEIDDPVFSKQLIGQTVLIRPSDATLTLVAPANGVLEVLYPTGHAYAIKMNNGLGLLIHIGIDTVEMNGKGFKALLKQGSKVRAGQPIVSVDFDKVKKAGYDTGVMMIVSENPDSIKLPFKQNQRIKASETILL